jgi:hypothetical protein
MLELLLLTIKDKEEEIALELLKALLLLLTIKDVEEEVDPQGPAGAANN